MQAISAAAIPKMTAFDAQSLTNTAWAFDVLQDATALDLYLPLAADRFCEIASQTSSIAGMSWVELQSVLVSWGAFGAQDILDDFERQISTPVGDILRTICSGSDTLCGDTAAVTELTRHVQRVMLPHLGVPSTRHLLALMGVALPVLESGYPSESIREECWSVGVW